MRVLVTGASGLVGRYLLPRLFSAGHEVIATTRPGSKVSPRAQSLSQDLLESWPQNNPLRSNPPDCLIHLAWFTTPGSYWASRKNLAWLQATIELVDRFIEIGGRRVVVAGTCAEYSWAEGSLEEDAAQLQPRTLYGATKLATWQLLQQICHKSGVDLLWGRIFFPYGPGERLVRLVPATLSAMLAGEPVMCSHGLQRRDFIHADDVASALMHLATGEASAGAYNLSSGFAPSIRQVVELCRQLTGSDSELIFGAHPVPRDDPEELLGPNAKLLSTGWCPQWSMEQGLRHYIGQLGGDVSD